MVTFARNLVVWLISILLAMPPQWALAADPIVVDPATPTAKATLTPSGKPMLNIVKPNAAGVSHNKFTHFNVTSQGLVVNNATATSITKLAGAIETNPNLAGTAASLILNEVTSSNRSTLSGATEIGGQAADYILANPNGITCNGCGFINTPRATLATGTPMFTGDALTALSVDGGNVEIEGLGLDATQATKFDIVTRAAAINAQINAQDLGIHTGRQDFDYAQRAGEAKLDNGSAKPAIAIDSTALGGMYAGRITLVGSEAGVGVRIAGDMGATASDMFITADGKLELKSKLSARQNIQLTSQASDITTDKSVYAGTTLTATASTGQVQANTVGSLGAAGDVTINAATVAAGTGGKIVAGLGSTGTLTTSGNLNVTATTLIATGEGFLGGGASVTLKAPTVALSRAASGSTETVRSRGTVTIESGNLTATNGKVASDGAMALKGNSPIVLGAGDYVSPTTITLTGDSVTSAATIVSDDQVNITSTTGGIVNTGSMTAGTSASLTSATDITNAGTVQSQTGTTLAAGQAITTQSGSKVKSATTTQLTAASLSNAGSVYAVSDLTIDVPTIANTGALAAGGNLRFNTTSLTNSAGVLHAENNLTVAGHGGAANATLFDNASGIVETVGGDIAINAATIKNRKSAFVAGSSLVWARYADVITTTSSNGVDRNGKPIPFRQRYTIHSPIGTYSAEDWANYNLRFFYYAGAISQDSAAAQMLSGRDITLTGTTINNDYSTISSVGDITVNTATFNNQAAALYSSLYYDRPQYTHLFLAQQATGSSSSLMRTGGNLTINATGGVRTGTEQINTQPPSNVTNVNTADLATAPAPSNLIDTAQYANLIPGMSALFVVSQAPKPKFLYETRADFVDLGRYYGSDYFLAKFGGFDPEAIPTRLGDAYFETQLVRQAILQQTGACWLNTTVQDDILQMKALLDGGLQAAQDLDLAFGITLTSAQIAALTRDIIWYEEAVVDGRTVLVPRVYLASTAQAKLDPKGAVLAGHDVTIDAASITNERGRILSDSDMTLKAQDDIDVTVGEIASNEGLTMNAGGDITVTGADISAAQNATLTADGDVTITAQETRQRIEHSIGYTDRVTNIASTVATGGNLTVNAGGNARIKGSTVTAGGDATLAAIGNVTVEASTDTFDAVGQRKGGSDELHTVTQNASTLDAGGNLTLTSGADARVTASKLQAGGDLTLNATGDVLIESAAAALDVQGRNYKLKTVTQQAAELTAGGDVAVGSLVGDVSIISSKIDVGGDLQLTTPGGTLYLGARKDYREDQLSSSKSGMFITTYSNRGSIDETVVPTLLTASGNLAIVTAGGVIVDYKDTGNLNDSIDQLSQASGLAWMNDLRGRTDVQWNAITEAHQHWDYRSQGISPTGAALISLAVSFAMPAGVGAGFTGAKAGSTFAAVSNAGFEALVSHAAQALVGNGGDIGAALRQLGSSATLKSLATSMVTAGLIEGLGVDNALSTPTNDLSGSALKMTEFTNNLKIAMAEGTIGAVVDSTINGAPLGDNLKSALISAAVNVVGAEAAQQIGLAAASGDLNTATQLIAHAALGCGMGAATSGDCQSGAIGGVAGEMFAQMYFSNDSVNAFHADLETTLSNKTMTTAEAAAKVAAWQRQGVNMSRLLATVGVAMAGGDAGTAAMTSGNAVENNICGTGACVAIVAAVMFGLELIDKGLMAKDAFDLAEAIESGDNERAAELASDFAIEAGVETTIGHIVPGSTLATKFINALRRKGMDENAVKATEQLLTKNADGDSLDYEITAIQNLGDPKAGIVNTSRVRAVNSRVPINSQKYAGTTLQLIGQLGQKYPYGVPFSGAGYPDFSRYAARNVRIELTGNRASDFKLANKSAGIDSTPVGMTWHHHQDAGYMQLVPTDLHTAVKHTGGMTTTQ